VGITVIRATDLSAALGVLVAPAPSSHPEGPVRPRPACEHPARQGAVLDSSLLDAVGGPQ
jgi:hypothetical protein